MNINVTITVTVAEDVYRFISNFGAERLKISETMNAMCQYSATVASQYPHILAYDAICIIARTIEFELNFKVQSHLASLGYDPLHFGIGATVNHTNESQISIYYYIRSRTDSYNYIKFDSFNNAKQFN